MKINKIPLNILDAVRQNLGAEDEKDTSQDSNIEKMSPIELMECWSAWNLGDKSWASEIIGSYNYLKELEKENGNN